MNTLSTKHKPYIFSLRTDDIYLSPYKLFLVDILKNRLNYEEFTSNSQNKELVKQTQLLIIGGNTDSSTILKQEFINNYKTQGHIIEIRNNADKFLNISSSKPVKSFSLSELKNIGPIELSKKISTILMESKGRALFISIDSRIIGNSYINAFNTTLEQELGPHELSSLLHGITSIFEITIVDYINSKEAISNHLFNQGNLQSAILTHYSILNSLNFKDRANSI